MPTLRQRFVHPARLAAALLFAMAARADVKLPGYYGDHMVVQREIALPIWGTDTAGTTVTVSFGGQTKTAVADDKGYWKVTFDALPGNSTGQALTVKGTTDVTLNDVLVGDLWVCSGQSNMAFTVGGGIDAKNPANPTAKIADEADFPLIRQLRIPNSTAADAPRSDVKGSWSVCTPATVKQFTAVGFFFAKDIQPQIGVPVGLIYSNWGGTRVEAWTRRDVLAANTRIPDEVATWERNVKAFDADKAKAKYDAAVEAWKTAAETAKADGKPAPKKPTMERSPAENQQYPSTLYNAMIAPLLTFPIKGALWYQGESNASRAWIYQTVFHDMIVDWRAQWGQGDFPFGFVQLANYMAVKNQPIEEPWPELREAQTMALALPNTGMAVISDVGEAGDIHPKDKIEVGHRLALWAAATVYGKGNEYSGPMYKGMTVNGNKVTLTFDHVGKGLMVGKKAPFTAAVADPDGKLGRFQIAGDDQKWVWADAVIAGDTVVVSNADVAAPVAVRYAWANNPEGANLYNQDGLPASPFRTDTWRLSSEPAPADAAK